MNTLYINTALKQTHIAVFAGETLLHEKSWDGYFHEFDTLIPAVEAMLADAKMTIREIHQGVVCVGPGGFTSVRLGVSTANALSFALQIPFAAIDLFTLLEHLHSQQKDLCIMIEANPEEIFIKGVGRWAKVFPEARLMKLADVISLMDSEAICVGQVSEATRGALTHAKFLKQDMKFSLPWNSLNFSKEIIAPWYYKEAKITERKG